MDVSHVGTPVGPSRLSRVTPAALAELVRSTAVEVLANRGLDTTVLPSLVTVERSHDSERGDYATNLALQSARKLNLPPLELATWLAEALCATAAVSSADIAGPGFVNLTLSADAWGDIVREVLSRGARYGHADTLAERRILLELVSAHPTSPLDLACVRSAAVGDAIARVLAAQGAVVTRQYHVNDVGPPIELFVASLIAVSKGEPAPEHGYAGGYLSEIAAEVLRREPSALSLSPRRRHETVSRIGIGLMLDQIKHFLCEFHVHVDRYVHESRARPSGAAGESSEALLLPAARPVRLVSAGKLVRIGKHAGTAVTADDLVEAVGVDAARYALIRSPATAVVDVDLDRFGSHTDENPLFRVQYAYARQSALLRNAADLGITAGARDTDLALFTDERETGLIGLLGDWPHVVRRAAELLEPHRIAGYLEELADACLLFVESCPVLPRGDEEAAPRHRARSRLCAACRQVLANGLELLGVTAPERM